MNSSLRSYVSSALSLAFVSFISLSIHGQTVVPYTATSTWTAPAGVTSPTVECWGGGGAGGGSVTTTVLGGGGGAGGSYARSLVAVTPGTVYTVTIGTGGIGTTAVGPAGTGSWFNTAGTIFAQGGAGGAAPNGGTVAGGTGSTATSIGTTLYAGGNGANGTTALSGGGGGGAGTTGAGGAAAGAAAGTGTALNGGTGGAGDNTAASESNGLPGNTYGGGGSGAMVSDGTDHSGGSGANGYVTITFTCPTYSLTGTAGSSPVFQGNSSTVTLSGSAAGLPVGTYTVTYNLSAPNVASGLTATMIVSAAGTGTFSTSALANTGATTVTITNLSSGTPTACSNAIGSNNTSVITVTAPPTYCASSATSSADMDITNITFGTINNTSATVNLTGTQGTATGTAGMFSNWRASTVPVPSLMQGSTTPFSVQIGGTAYSHRVDVYIDFNQDGDLIDAGESFSIFAYANPTLPNTTASSILIPLTASTGNTIMRVVCVESSTSTNGCGTYTWGETEDYTINITAAPPCAGTPTAGSASASPASICSGASSTVTLSGYSIASGNTFQWQSSPDNATWTNIAGATSTSYIATITSSTYYRCIVTCSNSGLSANSASVQVVVTLSASCYCTSAATSTADMDITNITFGTINNTSATVNLTGSQGTATGIAGGYSNFWGSTVPVPSVMQGSTSPFSVQIGGTAYSHRVDVYIDFNQDGDLIDAGESFVIFPYTNPALPNTTNSNIAVPITATAGNTLMRVVCVESSASNACGTYTWGETEDYQINITVAPPCSGVPPVATATASPSSICISGSSTLTVSGYPISSGLIFQWQSAPALAGPYTNIAGATSTSYIASPITNTYYRCNLTCTNSGSSTPTVGVLVSVITPTYAILPYTQSFEGPWLSICDTREAPDASWKNTPKTGNPSWRREDDGVAGAAWTSNFGIYAPVFSAGAHSARFHSYNTSLTGSLDLYVDCSLAGTKSLCFDYILNASSSANMSVRLSTDGGVTFPTTLGTITTSAAWTTYSYPITSTSATCVVRFLADGDNGSYDIGLDNVSIGLPSIPNCASYSSPANGATGITCGLNAVLYWASAGPSCSPPTSYDIYFGTSATPPLVANQTGLSYNPGSLLSNTTYYWSIIPRNGAGPATGCATWSFTTGATFTGSQTVPPISDGFENCLDWTIVNGTLTNKWQYGTATSNGGTRSMYISNDGGTTNAYTTTSTTYVHFYKDISLPAGMTTSLSFDWKAVAESCCDYIKVFLAPTTYTPVAGTVIPAAYQLDNVIFNGQSTWQSKNYTLPSCGGTTMRLIFSWKNDASGGTNPPGAVDNINIIAVPTIGQTCANPVNITLPYSRAGESTACMINNYTNASVSSCGTSFESGEDKVYKAVIGTTGCISVTISNANDNSVGFQVYNGCPDAAGTTCIANYGGATAGSLSGDINIPAIGTYYFVVDNFAGPANVRYDISISSVGGNTSNDAACSATALSLGIASNGDNTCTNGANEPAAAACWSTGTLNTVWYAVTVPASGDVYVSTTAISLLNTQIAAYTTTNCANAAAFTYIACNDNAPVCGGGTTYQNSELQLNDVAAAGSTIYIRVDGYASTAGTFSILAIDGNNGAPAWPPVPGQDCIVSNPVCNATMSVGNPGYFAWGNVCDFPSTSTCLASGERSTVWYTININANGNLTFDIVPNDYGNPNPITGQANPGYATAGNETDYDFALWKISGAGATTCAGIAAGAAAVKCSYSGLGVTGLFGTVNGTAPPAYPGFGGSYVSQQPVVNGEVYVLAISNFANNYVAGFSLVFGGSPPPVAMTATTTSVTWAGTSNTSWVQPGNWSNACSAPTCGISAVIAAGGAQPVITANSSVNNLTIDAGATLTINPGVILTVCGNFTNNGTLIASPTSTILFNNAAVTHTVSGNLTGSNKFGNLTINKTGGSVILANALEIGGNFTTLNATSILNASNLYLKIGGNFNTASNVTLINCPTIEFNGVIPQTFSNTAGTHALTNIVMNNTSSGLTLIGTANSNMVLSGALTLTYGVIYTSTAPILILNAGASSTSGSVLSFVDGPMQKIGNTAFVFPVGDAFNRWARIAMTAPTVSSTFQAQYFFNPYTDITTMAATPTPVLTYNVSAIEYWQCDRIAGTGNASLTLYWENAASSGINSCAALQGGDLVVARWNGSAWENRSNTIVGGITGSCVGSSAGTVTSDVLTAFSPFTFGSKSATISVNPLPIELISFTGKNEETKNILEWKTGSETNNDYFTLERSSNGYSFDELAVIDGAGTSNSTLAYKSVDENPHTGINYYRLKQTDFDGYVKYAPEIIALEYTPATEYRIYPNPATSEILLISSNTKEETVNINITDISGRSVYHQDNSVLKGNKNGTSIDITDLTEGIYYIVLYDAGGHQISQNRFVKVK